MALARESTTRVLAVERLDGVGLAQLLKVRGLAEWPCIVALRVHRPDVVQGLGDLEHEDVAFVVVVGRRHGPVGGMEAEHR